MMNVSKGLEALNQLKQCVTDIHFNSRDFVDIALDVGKQSETIEKELKALEIIKNKGANVGLLKSCCDYEEYIWKIHVQVSLKYSHEITEEEYDLLKEVLKNESNND